MLLRINASYTKSYRIGDICVKKPELESFFFHICNYDNEAVTCILRYATDGLTFNV